MPDRPSGQMAPPSTVQNAFDDPERLTRLIRAGTPYKSISAAHKEPPGTRAAPWFRNFWALGGKVVFPGAEDVFQNPVLIDAAKANFNAQIIEPLAMMTNLNPPAPAAAPHLDLPFFRGAHRREVPSWLLAPMGYSGLFQRWAIPVASAISWLYGGSGGAFEYWPDGLEQPSRCVDVMASNQAVIADNEYMYHRVGAIGSQGDYLPGNTIPYTAVLHQDTDGWRIEDEGVCIARYGHDQVRVSILWKAFCFADEAEARAYRENTDNLSPELIVDLFQRDLARRGVCVEAPQDLSGNDAWSDAIRRTYTAASPAASD